ncbi:hypothetical protein VTN49DRAFT_213 [Thermomyces lanuginosus]|uniref:uncharacterized protein n=1 Tax=Thermomyces lanuginosus TaxID=5541 RepID=UPI003742E167
MTSLQRPPVKSSQKTRALEEEQDEGTAVYELTLDPDELNDLPQLMIPVLHIMVRVFLRCELDEIVPDGFANRALYSPKVGWRSLGAQASALVEFVRESLSDVPCMRKVDDECVKSFYLTVKRTLWDTSFFTGHKSALVETPSGIGYIGIQYNPPRKPRPLVPLVVTTTSQSLQTTLSENICLMMSQLFTNLHRADDPADDLRDQETFLIGLHGSRLYFLRAWWPGLKTSAHWLHKENELIIRRHVLHHRIDTKNSGRTRWVVDREDVYSVLDDILDDLGGEPDLSTFRAVTSREFDLWCKEDFIQANRAVVALASKPREKHEEDESCDCDEESEVEVSECDTFAGGHNGGQRNISDEASTQAEIGEPETSSEGHWMDP